MTLRVRTLIVFAASLTGLVLAFYLVLSSTLRDSYSELEDRDVRENLGRVQAALRERVGALGVAVGDWAPWDDSYAFVQDGNQEFIDANFAEATLANLAISAVCYFDGTGNVVYATGFDVEAGTHAAVPVGLAELFGPRGPLREGAAAEGGLAGLIVLPGGPQVVAAQPILRSDRSGPPAGTLVMTRPLGDAQIAELAQQLRLSLSIHPEESGEGRTSAEEHGLSAVHPDLVEALDANRVKGATLVSDLFGRPALVLEVVQPRDVFRQGRAALRYLLAATIAVGGAIMILGLLLLDRVLRRVTKLSRSVAELGSKGDPATRLPVDRRGDELGKLSEALNGMLESLERAQDALRLQDEQHRAELQRKVEARTIELIRLNRALEKTVDELERAKERTERASRAKSEFLSRLSHELRTPLTAVLGFGQLLQDSELTTEQRSNVEDVVKAGRHLRELVDEVLDLTGVESGRMSIRLAPVGVGEVISEALDLVHAEADRNGVALHVPEPTSFSRFVAADRRRLRQVLINLLSNAIKYGGPGCRVAVTCDPGTDGAVRMSVRDSGPGLSAEQQQTLFVPFERLGAEKGEIEGLGLGLALSKRLVQAMGGTIGVESDTGHGSTFWVELPAAEDPSPGGVPETPGATGSP